MAPTPAECNELVTLFAAGHYSELESQAHLLLDRSPVSGFAWKVLGATLQAQEKNALPASKKAAEFLPEDAQVHYNLGVALQDNGRLDNAVASYRRALEIRPDLTKAHSNLGLALKALSSTWFTLERWLPVAGVRR